MFMCMKAWSLSLHCIIGTCRKLWRTSMGDSLAKKSCKFHCPNSIFTPLKQWNTSWRDILSVSEDFGIFAEVCFRAFGDRVKYWTTINEPLTFALYGYDLGVHAPGRCSPAFGNCTAGNSATEPYIVTHNMLLAHSAAVKIYRTKYQVRLCSVLNISALTLKHVSWIILMFENKLQGTQKGSIGMSLVVN